MIKLLIFDWDDVFTLGAKEGYFACYHNALTGVGVYLPPEEEKKRILAKWSKVIMKNQGVAPEETVFIGDAKTDVQMAYNAHVTPIVVLTGHLDRKSAEELGVRHIIADVTKRESILPALSVI